ncbi:MAG: ribosomal RNA large subunit methyltransferase J [Paracoccaceae bacterium]|nr:MAG: ribosomal RNA large subunit methyltransferase J [Paracoccaceae bacterium]
MLSYQHAYHAGGPADLLKHAALAGLVEMMTRKARGLTYAETHAGRGLYDLSGPEAARTGEAAAGIGRIRPAGALGAVLAAIRAAHGPHAYPGSPMIARRLLRPQDRMILFELHPAEHAALSAVMGSGAEIHRRDGFEGLLALAPPRPRAGLVLVDPSYEVKAEYAATARFVLRLLGRWPQAAVLVWYPILRAGRHAELLAGLARLGPLRVEAAFDLKGGAGMLGAGLVLANAPHGAGRVLRAALAAGAPVLRPMPGTPAPA